MGGAKRAARSGMHVKLALLQAARQIFRIPPYEGVKIHPLVLFVDGCGTVLTWMFKTCLNLRHDAT